MQLSGDRVGDDGSAPRRRRMTTDLDVKPARERHLPVWALPDFVPRRPVEGIPVVLREAAPGVLPRIEPGQLWVVESLPDASNLLPCDLEALSSANVVIYDRSLAARLAGLL